MECKACGHEHKVWDPVHKDYAWKDTKPFIHIEGDFSIESDFIFEESKPVKLFACPKCFTIQLEIPKRYK